MLRNVSLLCLSILGWGCAAHQSIPDGTPDHWSKSGYEWPPSAGANQEDPAPTERSPTTQTNFESRAAPAPSIQGKHARVLPPAPTRAPLQIGQNCLGNLRSRGVTFVSTRDVKGVENPVKVQGPLGGVTFWANDGRPLLLDCRLALALDELRDVFREHGLTRARFSGAYSYRRTRSGRLSHHALGLAIDLHDLSFGSKALSVTSDFARGAGCDERNPMLNRLACAMRRERLFEEFLTPDFNYDHRDHLHISVPRRKSEK